MLRMTTCAGVWCVLHFFCPRLLPVAVCSNTGSSSSIMKVAAANLSVLLRKHDLNPHQIKDERVRPGPPASTWCSSTSDILAWVEQPYLIPLCGRTQLHFVRPLLDPSAIFLSALRPCRSRFCSHYQVYIHPSPFLLFFFHLFSSQLSLRTTSNISWCCVQV